LRLGIGASATTGDATGLHALLVSAQSRSGWYADALARLHEIDAKRYFEAYRQAIDASVAP
jgi:hypothetical protein